VGRLNNIAAMKFIMLLTPYKMKGIKSKPVNANAPTAARPKKSVEIGIIA